MSDTSADTHPHDFPPWVGPLVAVPPVFFAVVSVVGVGEAWPVVAVAVSLAVLPWVLDVTGIRLPRGLFAAWAIVPIAVVNLAGTAFGVDLSGESHTQFTLMILVWLVGEMAAVARPRHLVATTVAALAVIGGRGVVEPAFGHSWVFWMGGAGIALITGYMLRRQQQTLSELRRAQAALAEDAVQRERQRIAREVHDVVAHTMTVTLMHLQAARRALDHEPDAVRAALEEAETLGRRSLSDIRRTVGLLRADDDAPETRALPEAGDITALLESYRTAGVTVRAEVRADLDALGPAASLTLYRLVQEALANAASHAAGAPVDLTVRTDGQDVVVDVSNPAAPGTTPGGAGGLGLVGMRERVRALGGTLRAGADGDRWRVQARVPAQTSAPTEVAP